MSRSQISSAFKATILNCAFGNFFCFYQNDTVQRDFSVQGISSLSLKCFNHHLPSRENEKLEV